MKVLLSGELRGRRGTLGCRLHDISRSGACIEADQAHQVGETVTFERATLRVTGSVVWSRGKRFGIAFDQPIRATELLVQMSHSRTAGSAATPFHTAQPTPAMATLS